MTTLNYFDIELIPTEDVSISSLINQAIQLIHSQKGMGDSKYALAFPGAARTFPTKWIRVFCEDNLILDSLRVVLSKLFFFRDYCGMGDLKTVPSNFNGNWVSYTRFRIQAAKTDRDNGNKYQKRMALAKDLPFLFISSSSTRSSFMLRFKINKESGPSELFKLNRYGLSSSTHPVALPDICIEKTD